MCNSVVRHSASAEEAQKHKHVNVFLGKSSAVYGCLHHTDRLMFRFGRWLAFIVILLSLLLVLFQVLAFVRQIRALTTFKDGVHRRRHLEVLPFDNVVPSQVVLAAGSWFLLRSIPTIAVARVASFLVLMWFSAWAKAVSVIFFRASYIGDDAAIATYYTFNAIGFASGVVGLLAWLRLFMLRAALVHEVIPIVRGNCLSGFRFVLVFLPLVWATCCGIAVGCISVYGVMPGDCGQPVLVRLWMCFCGTLVVGTCVLLVMTLRIFAAAGSTATRLAKLLEDQGDKRLAEECRFAGWAARLQACGFALGSMAILLKNVWWAMSANVGPLEGIKRAYWVGIIAEDVIVTIASLWLVGTFSGALGSARQRYKVQARINQKWWDARTVWLEAVEVRAERGPVWTAKVHELAERGFTLGALLDFYKRLGVEYMPHFASDRHTTCDVVRQAIIPFTADSKCSMAEIMMNRVPTVPQKMVTHNWDNRFRDLVAAILADALGEATFGRLSELLDADIAIVEKWVSEEGKTDKTYWVCAFSVNQHITMCNYIGTQRDTVTGLPYPLCKCNEAKRTPTQYADMCEVNKFDDMMRHLSAENPAFGQVVAIDARFKLFSRAWCVAELAAASEMGMNQSIKIQSLSAFDQNEAMLRTLRIEDMNASREEDKALILSHIVDHGRFNTELQRLLFDDLIPTWQSIDGEDQMARLTRLMRWEELPQSFFHL